MRLSFCLVLAVVFVAQADSPPDAQALIAKMRAAAASYSAHLHDFVCRETIVRSTSTDRKKWKPLETQEVEVGYIAHREHRRLLSVNGRTADAQKYVRKGYWIPAGSLGNRSCLSSRRRRRQSFGGITRSRLARGVDAFFNIPYRTRPTTYEIQADADHVRLGHSGFVTADCETGEILRMQMRTEPGSVKRGIANLEIGLNLYVRYGPVTIGGQEFLLPQDSSQMSSFGKTVTRVEIRFSDYRRFDSSSSIRFDDSGQ